ncbi:serine hydrolase domain-containing protein [Nonomuraea sp. NPDC046570]|uniref:serine hydrolase domain-containing protein n=1 Tax=Nonomuraea sp. NPDC046570 TaxID=3155255 RepID=UPI0033EF1F41
MDLDQVERAIASLVEPDAPGLAVGVYADGKVLRTAAKGVATVEFGVPVDATTRFDIASASKQFTAACLLLLARDGKLSLSDDVRKHLPELSLEVPVTLGQCLQHTGGLPEWYALQAITGVPLQVLSEERLMKIVEAIRRTAFEPGTDFSYSNTGYILAAVVVRRVTGQSLAEFARDRVFTPLGMTDTVYRDDASVPLPRMAYGYAGGSRADTEESAVGDGSLVTSVSDLASWFGFLADGRVLGADLRDALLERAILADGTVLPYAHGIYHTTIGDLPAYAHAGGMHGYVSNLLYLPGPDLGIAVLTNQSALDPIGLSEGLAAALTGQRPAAKPVLLEAGRAEAARPPLLGHWQDVAAGEAISLAPVAEGRIAAELHGEPVEFALGEDGRWQGQGEADGAWLALEDGRLLLGSQSAARRPVVFRPCAAPGDAPAPEGAWLSDELGVLAVHQDGELSVGLTLRLPVTPAPAGAWRAGPFTLRLDEAGDLLLSGGGLRGMRFFAAPEGTRPVGIPPGLV